MNQSETTSGRPTVLLTAAEGMAAHYLRQAFADCNPLPLQGHEGESAQTLLHCSQYGAPDTAPTEAAVAWLGKRNALNVVMISSVDVYGKEEGEMVDESSPTWPAAGPGAVMLQAERMMQQVCSERGHRLLILRAATMFGAEMEGEMARMFANVINGRYLHIRGNDARMSVVTALDVARAARALAGSEGIYNVADGHPCTRRELAEAMSANAGRWHRMSTLPLKWAKALSPIAAIVPALRPMLGSEAIRRSMLTLTFSAEKLLNATGLTMHRTIDVIARRSTDYPYEEE